MKDRWPGSGAHCMLGLVAVTASSSCHDGRLSSRWAAARMGFSAQQHIETSHNARGVGKLMHLETWVSVSTGRYQVAVRHQTNTLSRHPMYSPSSTHVRGAGTAGRASPSARKRELKLLNTAGRCNKFAMPMVGFVLGACAHLGLHQSGTTTGVLHQQVINS
jgi:hypothetical protein